MDMRFGTWNVRSIYRAGSLRAVAEGSIKRWEVLEWLHNWQLLKKRSAP
jgi:hypothetical protein